MRVLRTALHVFTSVFGCQHDRVSRPFTIEQQSYMVCLDCGHKLFYSMQEMRRLSRREIKRLRMVQAGSLYLAPVAGQASSLAQTLTAAEDPSLAA